MHSHRSIETSLDTGSIRTLRLASALAVVVPELGVRVRRSQQVLLEVGEAPDPDAEHPVVPACWFRCQVGDLHRRSSNGEQMAMFGLRHPDELVVELTRHAGDVALPGDLHRLDVAGGTMLLFATTLDLDRARAAAVVGDLEVDGEVPELLGVGFLHDEMTGVTLVQTTVPSGADPRPYLEVIHHVMSRCEADEWFGGLDGDAP